MMRTDTPDLVFEKHLIQSDYVLFQAAFDSTGGLIGHVLAQEKQCQAPVPIHPQQNIHEARPLTLTLDD